MSTRPALVYHIDSELYGMLISDTCRGRGVELIAQCWTGSNGTYEPETEVRPELFHTVVLLYGNSDVEQECIKNWWEQTAPGLTRQGVEIAIAKPENIDLPEIFTGLAVFEYSRSADLPKIVDFLLKTSSSNFTGLVGQLLGTAKIGEVKRISTLDGVAADFVVSQFGLAATNVDVIRCADYHDRPPTEGEFQTFSDSVVQLRKSGLATSGILVSRVLPSFDPNDPKFDDAVKLIGLEELEQRTKRLHNDQVGHFDREHFNGRILETRHKEIPKFVARRGGRLEYPDAKEIPDVQKYLLEECQSDSPSFILLFGDIGGGKTTQVRLLTYDLCNAYEQDGESALPLRVELESYLGLYDQHLGSYIKRALSDRSGVIRTWGEWRGDIERNDYVLLLDGLDEIKTIVTRQNLEREMKNILQTITNKTMCLVTSRPTIAESVTAMTNLVTEIARELNSELAIKVLVLNDVDDEQIAHCLEQAGKGSLLTSGLKDQYFDLCRRPLYIDVVSNRLNIDDLSTGPKSKHEITELAVQRLIEWRPDLYTPTGRKLGQSRWSEIDEDIALEMYRQNSRHISSGDIGAVVDAWGKDEFGDRELADIRQDVRVRTALDQHDRGFCFRHKAFLDFLAMHALARRMISPKANDRLYDGMLLGKEVLEALDFAVKKLLKSERQQSTLRSRDKPTFPLQGRGLTWVWIPGGLGVIGNGREAFAERGFIKHFDRGFWVLKDLVNVKDFFGIFRRPAAKGLKKEERWIKDHYESEAHPTRDLKTDEPLRHVTNSEATAICKTLGGRLPTEDEWERAIGGLLCAKPILRDKAKTNIWTVDCSTDSLYQWTSTKAPNNSCYICKGGWIDNHSLFAKGDPAYRFFPSRPWHRDTGFRVLIEDAG